MTFETYLWTTFAAFITLAIFSFLYKDNPIYKFAEHLFVGISAGYFVVILWHNGLVPNLFQRLSDGDPWFLWLNSDRPWYLIPGLLGVLMWTRFSRKYSWISRWPLALYIGIATGVAIPLYMANQVIKQLHASMVEISWDSFLGQGLFDIGAGYSGLIIFVGMIAGLIYFFFSKAHTGVMGGVAKFGIWILMIGFGASFGYTVMNRISLFINRLQFLGKTWLKASFDSANPNYHSGFLVLFWLIIAAIIAYIGFEVVQKVRRGPKPQNS